MSELLLRQVDPACESLALGLRDWQKPDAFHKCSGVEDVLGEERCHELSILVAKRDELARGEVVTVQTKPRDVRRGTHGHGPPFPPRREDRGFRDRQTVYVKPVRLVKERVFADDVQLLDAVQPMLR